MLGGYPTRGWRMWAFVARIVIVGLIGLALMLFINSA
jgi:hypothetical protein